MNPRAKQIVNNGVIVVVMMGAMQWAWNWGERQAEAVSKDLATKEIARVLKEVRLTCDKRICTNQGEELTPQETMSALYVYKQRAESYESTLRTVSEMAMP